MLKRAFDIVASTAGLIVFSPLLIPVMIAVWLQDYKSPFYIAPRVAKGGGTFRMVKLRSMVVNADKSGVDSTSANDMRITSVGHFIRRYKLDELMQLWNVFKGDMSLVGPRPNVQRDVALYTEVERGLLKAKPGITDLASIVFADEGDILAGSADPDLRYNQIIRPWKSRLGLLCIERQSFALDFRILILTATTLVSRSKALQGVVALLKEFHADPTLISVARRESALQEYPPPGATEVVRSRLVPQA